MSEDKKRDIKTDEAKDRFGRYGLALFAAAGVLILCLAWKMGLLNFRSADDKLAAINAARAIPESEDAGVAYRKLAEDYLHHQVYSPALNRQNDSLTITKPWSSKEYPQLAVWLDEWQDLISRLLDISKMEKCRLPMISGRQQGALNNPIRQIGGWVSLLGAANLDAGEGRINAAIEKYACVLQMGSHLRQQPVVSYYRDGVATELLALIRMEELITQTEPTEMQLSAIEAALLPAGNKWKQHSKILVKVQRLFEQRLFEQKQRRRPRITDWRRYWEYWKATSKSTAASKSDDHLLHDTYRYHLFTLANRRRTYILIALKRFRNKTGHWPRSLEKIEPPLSREILTDPVNNKLFFYELKGGDFTLSDRGRD